MNNKAAYLELRNAIIGGGINKVDDEEYYVLHSTSYENMLDILKTGKLMANKYLPPEKRRMSGFEESDYVFANIVQRKDMGMPNFGCGLIFSSDLLKKNKFYFNPSWYAYPYEKTIEFEAGDAEFDKKKRKMFSQIKDGSQIKHEILFENSIDLKYLIGIHCPECTTKKIKKIKKLIKRKKKIKIYSDYMIPILG